MNEQQLKPTTKAERFRWANDIPIERDPVLQRRTERLIADIDRLEAEVSMLRREVSREAGLHTKIDRLLTEHGAFLSENHHRSAPLIIHHFN